ncbi:hypothetical protein KIN20_017399 [Parelaphostrongylus tenuis]|uniref:Uncharacterized protein n=1 Tax=Parelaphostrongylus tenuis TaxID=148309 RepID=A0AAD5QQR0_PARTN|nr:hypothetical protein KIN20_017399 [Parelaphostrongylus tenuis]
MFVFISLDGLFGWKSQVALFISYAKAIELLIVCYLYSNVASRMIYWSSVAGKKTTCFFVVFHVRALHDVPNRWITAINQPFKGLSRSSLDMVFFWRVCNGTINCWLIFPNFLAFELNICS